MNAFDFVIADAHAHFFSHRFFETLARSMDPAPSDSELYQELSKHLDFDFPSKDPAKLAERWVQELDQHRVEKMVVMASVPGDEDSVSVAAKVAPERLIPYFMLDPTRDDALMRAERAFFELGMKGLALFPAMHHYHLWDDSLQPILARVNEAKGVVFVHCGVLKLGIRDKLSLPSPFDLRFANPTDINGVAKAFPSLPFVVPHFGGGFFRELLMTASECANVYTDTSSSNNWRSLQPEPLELATVFRRAIEVMGVERVLYGSDSSFFPRGWQRAHFEEQYSVLTSLGLSESDLALILGGTLNRMICR